MIKENNVNWSQRNYKVTLTQHIYIHERKFRETSRKLPLNPQLSVAIELKNFKNEEKPNNFFKLSNVQSVPPWTQKKIETVAATKEGIQSMVGHYDTRSTLMDSPHLKCIDSIETFPVDKRYSSQSNFFTLTENDILTFEERNSCKLNVLSNETQSTTEETGCFHAVNCRKTSSSEESEPPEQGLDNFFSRISWLVSLLILQSFISLILERFKDLVQHHPIILYYLTMLVGAGGNAGTQSTALLIRSLAVGSCKKKDYMTVILDQCRIGLYLSFILAIITFFRLYIFEHNIPEIIAVSTSMFVITLSSVLIGTLCPILFKQCKIDPAHAGATSQVLMDLVSVCLICLTAILMLDIVLPFFF
ncbi:uncharacterized protein LOC128883920 isoform X2 [Hylaeus volcanicus]|uniref:uncharacterized protein LOC128883920 isoform X2 n=1 Tax=Hylaeus volcanicus TaxID=313075 RepID=UPI0023B80EC1|nr:uncharacterized protein LOC128883920 isoform X2 [Hylaeus volcanicus]